MTSRLLIHFTPLLTTATADAFAIARPRPLQYFYYHIVRPPCGPPARSHCDIGLRAVQYLSRHLPMFSGPCMADPLGCWRSGFWSADPWGRQVLMTAALCTAVWLISIFNGVVYHGGKGACVPAGWLAGSLARWLAALHGRHASRPLCSSTPLPYACVACLRPTTMWPWHRPHAGRLSVGRTSVRPSVPVPVCPSFPSVRLWYHDRTYVAIERCLGPCLLARASFLPSFLPSFVPRQRPVPGGPPVEHPARDLRSPLCVLRPLASDSTDGRSRHLLGLSPHVSRTVAASCFLPAPNAGQKKRIRALCTE